MVVFAGFINLSYHFKLSISKLSLLTSSSYDFIFDCIKPGTKKLKMKQDGCRLEYAGCKQEKLGKFH